MNVVTLMAKLVWLFVCIFLIALLDRPLLSRCLLKSFISDQDGQTNIIVFADIHFISNTRSPPTHTCIYYWASEASPTLGCSIEISRDIYISVCMSVCLSYVKLIA